MSSHLKLIYKFRQLYLNLASEPGDVWFIALRRRKRTDLYDGENSPFFLEPNGWRYWRADPFLFEYEDKTFIFAELYDRIVKRGVIGVAEVKNGRCGRFKVCIRSKHHLSYPCIYKRGADIYMLPECYQSGKIIEYRCKKWPYKWEKYRTIADICAVDTTPLNLDEDTFLTTIFQNHNVRRNDSVSLITSEGKPSTISVSDLTSRSAGHLIEHNGIIIRPSQDCSATYGGRLVFRELSIQNGIKIGRIITAINPPNTNGIVLCGLSNSNLDSKDFIGIHTYNASGKYEIIDVKTQNNHSIVAFLRHFPNYILHKLTNAKQ